MGITKESSQKVLLDSLLHNNLFAYMKEGYGARPIEEWPFYRFISIYLSGEKERAIEKWVEWLFEQFEKYRFIDKKKGGMLRGSVHRLAIDSGSCRNPECFLNPGLLTIDAIRAGALKLVQQRLLMVESIKNKGYQVTLSGKVMGVWNKNKKIVLKSGHHRAATLKGLGYKEMPELHVYSPLEYNCRTLLDRFKSALSIEIEWNK